MNFKSLIELIIVCACVRLQDQILRNSFLSSLKEQEEQDHLFVETDKVICAGGYGPEDWDWQNLYWRII